MTLTNTMVLPKIEAETTSRNYGKFIISPLESGYGEFLSAETPLTQAPPWQW